MLLLETHSHSPPLDLALDEALLETAALRGIDDGLLRIWEFSQPAVVLGRSSQASRELQLNHCRQAGIAVLRRTSGGCAIVAGPGCLMYSLLLSLQRHPQLRAIDQAHAWVLGRMAAALSAAGLAAAEATITRAGTSDLVFTAEGSSIKFSGNSLRIKQSVLLYHGTVLYDFPLAMIDLCLRHPPREPDYRAGRSHHEFVGNLPATRNQVRDALIDAFDARGLAELPPRELVEQLVRDKYSCDLWNLRH